MLGLPQRHSNVRTARSVSMHCSKSELTPGASIAARPCWLSSPRSIRALLAWCASGGGRAYSGISIMTAHPAGTAYLPLQPTAVHHGPLPSVKRTRHLPSCQRCAFQGHPRRTARILCRANSLPRSVSFACSARRAAKTILPLPRGALYRSGNSLARTPATLSLRRFQCTRHWCSWPLFKLQDLIERRRLYRFSSPLLA